MISMNGGHGSVYSMKMGALIGQIQAALQSYRDANGYYPGNVPRTKFNGQVSDFYSDTFMQEIGKYKLPKLASDLTEADWRIINHELKLALQSVDPDTFRITTSPDDPRGSYIVDPSGSKDSFHVFRYRPATFYPLGMVDDKAHLAIDSDKPPNPTSYQLWSCGKDGIDEFGEAELNINGVLLKGDDITNWSRR